MKCWPSVSWFWSIYPFTNLFWKYSRSNKSKGNSPRNRRKLLHPSKTQQLSSLSDCSRRGPVRGVRRDASLSPPSCPRRPSIASARHEKNNKCDPFDPVMPPMRARRSILRPFFTTPRGRPLSCRGGRCEIGVAYVFVNWSTWIFPRGGRFRIVHNANKVQRNKDRRCCFHGSFDLSQHEWTSSISPSMILS